MVAGIGKLDYPISQKADYGFWIKECPKLEIRYASLRRFRRPKFIRKSYRLVCRAGWVARSFFRAMVSVLTENNSCRSKINSRKSIWSQNVTKLFDGCAEWRPVLENSVIPSPKRQILDFGSKSVRNSKFDTRPYVDFDVQILYENPTDGLPGRLGRKIFLPSNGFRANRK